MLRMFAPVPRIVAGVGELMADLGLVDERRTRSRREPPSVVLAELGGTEQLVARQLRAGRLSVDEFATATDLPVATVLGALTMLELRGLVTGVYGRYRPTGRLASASAEVA
jgi:predicted Rossmann fold nucleotide-binding protein DprA/Smf involved in DNA uptake